MAKKPTFYDTWKANRHVYIAGDRGTQVIIYPDGTKDHPKLTPAERKELDVLVRVEKMLAKVSQDSQEYNQLLSIPSSIGFTFYQYFGNIKLIGMKPEALKRKLMDDYRYHGLLRRG